MSIIRWYLKFKVIDFMICAIATHLWYFHVPGALLSILGLKLALRAVDKPKWKSALLAYASLMGSFLCFGWGTFTFGHWMILGTMVSGCGAVLINEWQNAQHSKVELTEKINAIHLPKIQ